MIRNENFNIDMNAYYNDFFVWFPFLWKILKIKKAFESNTESDRELKRMQIDSVKNNIFGKQMKNIFEIQNSWNEKNTYRECQPDIIDMI